MAFIRPIIKGGGTTPTGYVRPVGVPDGESIIANAPIIESGGVNYYPIYYICAMDTFSGTTFTKTGTGTATGADAYVFSDEPETLYVGTSVAHTFDVADDYATDQSWKCRYVIMYATEANKNDSAGITINLYAYRATFEIIGGQYLKLSSTSAVSGYSLGNSVNKNLRYVNLSNSSIYNTTISVSDFCSSCSSLTALNLPALTTVSGENFCIFCYSLTTLNLSALTTVSGGYFCSSCYSLTTLNLPALATVSGSNFCSSCYSFTTLNLPALATVSGSNFFDSCRSLKTLNLPALATVSGSNFYLNCYSLTTLNLPALATVSGSNFCSNCHSLEYFKIPNTISAITNTSTITLNYTQFIELPIDFDIDAVNFTGQAGYNKSYNWLNNELPTKLKDNSGGTAKTMTIEATNIALITAENQAIISAKNWTLA